LPLPNGYTARKGKMRPVLSCGPGQVTRQQFFSTLFTNPLQGIVSM
jgi:hypothetical protein